MQILVLKETNLLVLKNTGYSCSRGQYNLFVFLSDLAAVAKAAVNGDQGALDMFDWNKPGQQKFSMGQAESIQMYFGTKDGIVFWIFHMKIHCF